MIFLAKCYFASIDLRIQLLIKYFKFIIACDMSGFFFLLIVIIWIFYLKTENSYTKKLYQIHTIWLKIWTLTQKSLLSNWHHLLDIVVVLLQWIICMWATCAALCRWLYLGDGIGLTWVLVVLEAKHRQALLFIFMRVPFFFTRASILFLTLWGPTSFPVTHLNQHLLTIDLIPLNNKLLPR